MRDAVEGLLRHKKLLLLPANNYFLVNLGSIEDILYKRFPVERVEVTKTFPGRIEINVEEKISTLIYDNGYQFAYIDTSGQVTDIIRYVGDTEWQITRKTVSSTDEFGDVISEQREVARTHKISRSKITEEMGEYPIIYHKKEQGGQSGLQINDPVLKELTVEKILSWIALTQMHYGDTFHISHITLEREMTYIEIHLVQGGYFIVSPEDADRQLTELSAVLDVIREKNAGSFQYIDLRAPGKAYWK